MIDSELGSNGWKKSFSQKRGESSAIGSSGPPGGAVKSQEFIGFREMPPTYKGFGLYGARIYGYSPVHTSKGVDHEK